ncbi:flavin reductase family protein [Vagococcus silagei]|uniref:Flavin reductase family protein n=1 Tax=Vagococcus silagei TaxID=2508885 RepID=A0A4V3TV14_9ENTE|nr:flavin reductase family protein [Vagococcus silagei]THB61119.1 flavin reductase family protein [Vagococcus silagei]
MISINPNEQTERDNYKLLTGSIIPRPVALVTSYSEAGVLNIAPFSYFNIVTSNPPIVSLAIQRKEGEMKDTARNIVATKEAVIHVMDETLVSDGNQTAANLAAEKSELALTEFNITDSTRVLVPGIEEAAARFEVTLYQHVPIVENDKVTADLVLLKIEQYHFSEEVYEEGKIKAQSLAPVSRLAGQTYANLGEQFELVRPK